MRKVTDNTNETGSSGFSIQQEPVSPAEDVRSAEILLSEGLFEEAKRILRRLLMRHPEFAPASELLGRIQEQELRMILDRDSRRDPEEQPLRNPDEVIRKLLEDLGMDASLPGGIDPAALNWAHSPRASVEEAFDLGVAFFEMGCFRDAIVELEEALRMIRIGRSELGPAGVAAAALCAEAMVNLADGFAAKSFLIPVLNEPELKHEEKIPLFYLVGRAEEILGNHNEAKGWFGKVIEADPLFRDAEFRVRTGR